MKILQLSDFHYDPKYKVGGNANCNADLCCRDDLNENDLKENAAGPWGGYRQCDSPWNAIENLIMEVNKTHKVTLKYFFIF